MRETAEQRARPWLVAAVAALLAGVLVLAAVVVVEPSVLVALLPDLPAGGVASGRALQVFGALLFVLPVLAVVAAARRGARATRWLAVLAVLAFVPAVAAIIFGADRARDAAPVDPTDGACVERSGGETTCPGG